MDCDGSLCTARSRDPLLCTPMPIDGVLCNGKLLNAVLCEPKRWGKVLAATRAAQVAATPAGVKTTRLATCCRLGTATGLATSSARARRVAGKLVGCWVALARETTTVRLPLSR